MMRTTAPCGPPGSGAGLECIDSPAARDAQGTDPPLEADQRNREGRDTLTSGPINNGAFESRSCDTLEGLCSGPRSRLGSWGLDDGTVRAARGTAAQSNNGAFSSRSCRDPQKVRGPVEGKSEPLTKAG